MPRLGRHRRGPQDTGMNYTSPAQASGLVAGCNRGKLQGWGFGLDFKDQGLGQSPFSLAIKDSPGSPSSPDPVA